MKIYALLFCYWLVGASWWCSFSQEDIFLTREGRIAFVSEAPLELIQAQSDQLQGALNASKRTFAFAIPMSSFEGFNEPLQQEHFCEKFLECDRFPKASFQGHLIESPPLHQPGRYTVRVKGQLTIHGVSQERILTGEILREGESLSITSRFTVPLEDHDIRVPRVVYQKVAEIISVEVSATLNPHSR